MYANAHVCQVCVDELADESVFVLVRMSVSICMCTYLRLYL